MAVKSGRLLGVFLQVPPKIHSLMENADDVNPFALNEALAYVRNGDVFVITKLGRHARSVHDLMQITQMLQDKNCDLQVLDQELDTSTPTGRLIFHVLAVIDEFEKELISERVNEGQIRAMAAGVKFGRKPKLSKVGEDSLSS